MPLFGNNSRSRFERIFITLIQMEGGYVNNPDDPGGETKYGISKATYPELDIANLTIEDAKDIYWAEWWNGDVLYLWDFPIGEKLFLIDVNTGYKQAIRILQRAIRACTLQPIKDDGIVGPITRRTYERCTRDSLLIAMRSENAAFYRDLASKEPKRFKQFLNGWIDRAYGY